MSMGFRTTTLAQGDNTVASRRTRIAGVVAALAAATFAVPAAANDLLREENRQREALNAWSMSVLGSWALANIGVGVAGWATASHEQLRSFHLMNAGWNVVNLGIAAPSLIMALGRRDDDADLWDTLAAGNGIRTALLVNAALDVAYVFGGAYLALRGDRDGKPQLVGLGQSVMLQGAFLFAFDLTVWSLHTARNARFRKALRATDPATLFPRGTP